MLLTFVIVGGGPTGVEMAGAVAEIARHSLKHEFRHIDPSDAQILLIEAGDRVLGAYPPELVRRRRSSRCERLGVTVRTKTMVTDVARRSCRCCNWAAARERLADANGRLGGRRRGLAAGQACWRTATGATLDRAGRIVVEPDLSLPGHPEIFVLGDMANYLASNGPAAAGRRAGRDPAGPVRGEADRAPASRPPLPTFHYRDRGNMATIGRSAAVADFGKLRFSGFVAWMLWLVVHLMNLVSFRNRLLVLVQWGWNYFTYDRSARLITNPPDG